MTRRPHATPTRYESDWRDALSYVAEAVAAMLIFLAIFIGVPLALWLVGS
jgi:hypothetical protein